MFNSPFQRKNLLSALILSGFMMVGFTPQTMAADSAAKAPPSKPLPKVSVMEVVPETLPIFASVMGRVEAKDLAEIRPQVTGIILSRHFEEGAFVEKGQLLYQIDDASYQATYDSAVASVSSAKSTLENAKLIVKRNKRIVKINAISEQDVDNSIAAENAAEAQVLVAQAALKSAKINLERTKIRSPISGIIGRSLVMPGALVTANQVESLALVQDLDELYVDYAVPSHIAISLGQAYAATKTWPAVNLVLPSGKVYSSPGQILMLDKTVNPQRDTVVVRVAFENAKSQLLPGLFVKGDFKIGEQENVVLIPPASLTRDSFGNPMVMVLGGENKVTPRPITEDGLFKGQWRVVEGLNKGDQLIIKGLQFVRPGSQVQVDGAAKTTGAGA